jgi:hypothetical protein
MCYDLSDAKEAGHWAREQIVEPAALALFRFCTRERENEKHAK